MINPTPYSDDVWEALRGDVVVRCVKSGGHTMASLGQYVWEENEERSLFDESLPDTIRAGEYGTALNMITDPACELSQLVISGDFTLVLIRRPALPDEVRS